MNFASSSINNDYLAQEVMRSFGGGLIAVLQVLLPISPKSRPLLFFTITLANVNEFS